MSEITLQYQVECAQALHDVDGTDTTAAILASLKRLREMENQEPVAYMQASSVSELINMGSAEVYSKKYSASSLPLYTLPVKG